MTQQMMIATCFKTRKCLIRASHEVCDLGICKMPHAHDSCIVHGNNLMSQICGSHCRKESFFIYSCTCSHYCFKNKGIGAHSNQANICTSVNADQPDLNSPVVPAHFSLHSTACSPLSVTTTMHPLLSVCSDQIPV
jgi:hypothetical protein